MAAFDSNRPTSENPGTSAETFSSGSLSQHMDPFDSIRFRPDSLPEELKPAVLPAANLPPLSMSDLIMTADLSHQLTETISAWPLLKSGYVLRRDFPSSHSARTAGAGSRGRSSSPSPSTTSVANRSRITASSAAEMVASSSRQLGRNFASFLTGGKKKALQNVQHDSSHVSASSTFSASLPLNVPLPSSSSTFTVSSTRGPTEHVSENISDDEWALLYCEIRGRYMFFYALGSEASVFPTAIPPGATTTSLARRASVAHASPPTSPAMGNSSRGAGSRVTGAIPLLSRGESGSGYPKALNVFSKWPKRDRQTGLGKRASFMDPNFSFQSGGLNALAAASNNAANKHLPAPHVSSGLASRDRPAIPGRHGRTASGGSGGPEHPPPATADDASDSHHSRHSSESQRSLRSVRSVRSFVTGDFRNSPRTLIHYVSLNNVQVELVKHTRLNQMIMSNFEITTPVSDMFATSFTPSNAYSYLLVEYTSGRVVPGSAPNHLDQLILDFLIWDDGVGSTGWQPSGNISSYFTGVGHEQGTVTSLHSILNRSASAASTQHTETPLRKQEMFEWMHAIRTVAPEAGLVTKEERISLSRQNSVDARSSHITNLFKSPVSNIQTSNSSAPVADSTERLKKMSSESNGEGGRRTPRIPSTESLLGDSSEFAKSLLRLSNAVLDEQQDAAFAAAAATSPAYSATSSVQTPEFLLPPTPDKGEAQTSTTKVHPPSKTASPILPLSSSALNPKVPPTPPKDFTPAYIQEPVTSGVPGMSPGRSASENPSAGQGKQNMAKKLFSRLGNHTDSQPASSNAQQSSGKDLKSKISISSPMDFRKLDNPIVSAGELIVERPPPIDEGLTRSNTTTREREGKAKEKDRKGNATNTASPPQPQSPATMNKGQGGNAVTNVVSAIRDKARAGKGEKDKKEEKKDQLKTKTEASKLVISSPIPASPEVVMQMRQTVAQPGPLGTPEVGGITMAGPQSASAAALAGNSKLFFPFFNKFSNPSAPTTSPVAPGPKERDLSPAALVRGAVTGFFQPAGGLLIHRSNTINSNTSTLRRRVGTKQSRPPSGASSYVTTGEADGAEVPLILRKCITLVEQIGLESEGLYRVSGSAATVDKLRRLFDLDPTKVHLYPPASSSPLVSSLSSPFISDFTPSLARRASRLSLTETISSSRSSAEFASRDWETAAPPPVPPIPSSVRTQKRQSMGPGIEVGRGAPTPPLANTPSYQHGRQSQQGYGNFFSFHGRDNQLPNVAGYGRDSPMGPLTPGMVSGSSLYDNDVHVVTGVIKGYLRDGLPPDKEPICTYNLYDAFIEAAQMDDWRAKMITIQDLVHSLPARHFACLKYVCEHLRRVSLQSPINKMSIRNLSIIFGPNLLKPPPAKDSIGLIMQNMQHQCSIAEILIEQAEWVFGPIEFEEEAPTFGEEGEGDDAEAYHFEGFSVVGSRGPSPLPEKSPAPTLLRGKSSLRKENDGEEWNSGRAEESLKLVLGDDRASTGVFERASVGMPVGMVRITSEHHRLSTGSSTGSPKRRSMPGPLGIRKAGERTDSEISLDDSDIGSAVAVVGESGDLRSPSPTVSRGPSEFSSGPQARVQRVYSSSRKERRRGLANVQAAYGYDNVFNLATVETPIRGGFNAEELPAIAASSSLSKTQDINPTVSAVELMLAHATSTAQELARVRSLSQSGRTSARLEMLSPASADRNSIRSESSAGGSKKRESQLLFSPEVSHAYVEEVVVENVSVLYPLDGDRYIQTSVEEIVQALSTPHSPYVSGTPLGDDFQRSPSRIQLDAEDESNTFFVVQEMLDNEPFETEIHELVESVPEEVLLQVVSDGAILSADGEQMAELPDISNGVSEIREIGQRGQGSALSLDQPVVLSEWQERELATAASAEPFSSKLAQLLKPSFVISEVVSTGTAFEESTASSGWDNHTDATPTAEIQVETNQAKGSVESIQQQTESVETVEEPQGASKASTLEPDLLSSETAEPLLAPSLTLAISKDVVSYGKDTEPATVVNAASGSTNIDAPKSLISQPSLLQDVIAVLETSVTSNHDVAKDSMPIKAVHHVFAEPRASESTIVEFPSETSEGPNVATSRNVDVAKNNPSVPSDSSAPKVAADAFEVRKLEVVGSLSSLAKEEMEEVPTPQVLGGQISITDTVGNDSASAPLVSFAEPLAQAEASSTLESYVLETEQALPDVMSKVLSSQQVDSQPLIPTAGPKVVESVQTITSEVGYPDIVVPSQWLDQFEVRKDIERKAPVVEFRTALSEPVADVRSDIFGADLIGEDMAAGLTTRVDSGPPNWQAQGSDSDSPELENLLLGLLPRIEELGASSKTSVTALAPPQVVSLPQQTVTEREVAFESEPFGSDTTYSKSVISDVRDEEPFEFPRDLDEAEKNSVGLKDGELEASAKEDLFSTKTAERFTTDFGPAFFVQQGILYEDPLSNERDLLPVADSKLQDASTGSKGYESVRGGALEP